MIATLPFVAAIACGDDDGSGGGGDAQPGAVCGGRGGAVCPEGQYCDFPLDAHCGAADEPGACAEIPATCIEIVAPVCGCDGQTYDNDCFAAMAGVSVESEASCSPTWLDPVDRTGERS